MFAIGAVIAFVLGLVMDVADFGGEWLSALMWIGLALVAAHLAFGYRFTRRL